MVPEAGLEPAHLAAGDFESPASTNSATRATPKTLNFRMIGGQWHLIDKQNLIMILQFK